MLYAQVHLTLPAWVHDAVDTSRAYASDADKVALAILLSNHNVEAQSGGPFGAAVFGPDDRIISVGVNRVLPQATSLAHAENMAYMLAQQRTQRRHGHLLRRYGIRSMLMCQFYDSPVRAVLALAPGSGHRRVCAHHKKKKQRFS